MAVPIRSDAPSNQSLAGYVNANANVAAYAFALSKTSLPVLQSPPSWYAGFSQQLAVAQGHALIWINSVLPNIQMVPAAIVSADALVQQQFQTLVSSLQLLVTNPSNAAALRAAQAALATVQTQLTAVKGAVSTLEQSITDFAADLIPDSTTLAKFVAQAKAAEGADQAAIDKLNSSVQNLQNLITAKNEYAEADRIGKGVLALFLVVTAATIGWLGGPVVDGLLGMAAIGLLAGFGDKLKTDVDIQEQVTQIANIKSEIGPINVEIGLLQTTANNFAALTTENSTAQQNIQLVENFWVQPLEEVSEVLSNLSFAGGDLSSAKYSAALSASTEALSLWNTLVGIAKPLTQVQFNFDNTVTMLPGITKQ